jgi:hypothetical protein
MGAKIRITAFIGEGLAEEFAGLTRQIGVSGTALLSRTLPAELKYLADLPGNNEREETAWRLFERLLSEVSGTRPKVRRLNVTLDRQDAERMSRLCREKRVRRDSFIGSYIAFLVGEEGPLRKISELLTNPRHEYEEKRRNSPEENVEWFNPKEQSFNIIPGVPRENPYSHLHIDEDQLALLDRAVNNRTPENK